MGLLRKFFKKKETTKTEKIMINTRYNRFIHNEYTRLILEEMGAKSVTGLDTDKLTEKLLYFYDNNIPVTERIPILMNTFNIDNETAERIEYVAFSKTALLSDYFINKEKGATKFDIEGINGMLKTNLNINEFANYVGFMINNDGVPIFNVKTIPKTESKQIISQNEPKIIVEEVDETENNGNVGIQLGMKLPPMIEKDPKDLTELDKIKNREIELHDKLNDINYYGSEISRIEFRELNENKKEYIKNNPKEYLIRGAGLYGYLWGATDSIPTEEQEILKLMGMGLYYEDDLEQYEEAIEIYRKAYNLTWETMGDKLMEFIEEWGDGDYLFTAKCKDRIRICRNKKYRADVKKLEAEAKELEKTDPKGAIKKYEELNEFNPGLKKYDKRIYRMMELEAKELEKTDPLEAIKKYEELNVLNPGLKKYDKRIEIIKRKLE